MTPFEEEWDKWWQGQPCTDTAETIVNIVNMKLNQVLLKCCSQMEDTDKARVLKATCVLPTRPHSSHRKSATNSFLRALPTMFLFFQHEEACTVSQYAQQVKDNSNGGKASTLANACAPIPLHTLTLEVQAEHQKETMKSFTI